MDEIDGPLLSIGAAAARTGLPVRTIRFWSDSGLVPPTARTSSRQRRYGPAALARLELVSTLRSLGIGLEKVRAILDQRADLRQIAAIHAQAMQAEIRVLSVRRAVLLAVVAACDADTVPPAAGTAAPGTAAAAPSTADPRTADPRTAAAALARFAPSPEEINLMTELARLSAAQRQQLVDDFLTDTFGDGPDRTGIRARMRELTPALPDDPSPDQVNAWIEVAGLVQDASFRRRVREMAQAGAQQGEQFDRHAGRAFAAKVAEQVGPALAEGIDPASAAGAAIVDRVLPDAGPAKRAELAGQLATFTDARVDRYWQLVGRINGWPPVPSQAPAFRWLIGALGSHPAA